MARKVLVGIAMVMAVVAWEGRPAAAQNEGSGKMVAPERQGAVRFTSGSVQGEPTLMAEAHGVRFFKRVGREKVLIRIEVPGDSLEVAADAKGAVRLGRKGRFIQLQMNRDQNGNIARAEKLMAGSAALIGFEAMAAMLALSDRQEARSVMTSYALVHAVRGTSAPARDLMHRLRARTAANMVRASVRDENPNGCWMDYASTVNTYLSEFSACVTDFGWVPGVSSACAFEFSIKAELAWFWLLGCSGGIPV
jgi:hypothetical protein